ncbi:type II toxin-antitoxin system MqsR family toxin [Rhodopila globiformis]|nr:type II toxin-antitoxin system MqsR family toxin [Rhodopila globiformis]
MPANALETVRRLVADERTCSFFQPVLAELRRHDLDSDDLREILATELGEIHCFKSKPTEKYFPQTTSDYYSIWIDGCGTKMFIKLLVSGEKLVVTSFKRDERYE